MQIIARCIGALLLLLSTPSTAHTAERSVTILVRDADGNRLSGVWIVLFLPQPPAEPRRVAEKPTDADGRLVIERLDADQDYIVQFTSGIPIIIDGQQVDSIPSQYEADQNALRGVRGPTDAAGWLVQAGGGQVYRFVIGGTFAEGKMAAAVPMLDRAETDDAPVRPVNPLTGDEMTPEQARTFHATIGEPWSIAASPRAVAPIESMDDPTLDTSAATDQRRLNGVLMIVALCLAIQVVMLWRRRQQV